jgi:cytochrome c peroxidase
MPLLRRLSALTCVVLATTTMWAGSVRVPFGLDVEQLSPRTNPASRAKIQLGRRLFSDPNLSSSGRVSCATCHDPRRAFTDGRTVAIGVDGAMGDRNVPTLVNRAWGQSFFWDGRATTLEQQVLQPVFAAKELGMSADAVLSLLRSPRYRSSFEVVFGAKPTLDHLALALASYVRTILAGDSPYDRFEAGDRSALSQSAAQGLAVFRLIGGCSACHNGPNLTDEAYHNTGVAWRLGPPQDEGRAGVTHAPADIGAFKTPTLRQISRTGPYMHDGSFATLAEVIEFYDRGGQRNAGLDEQIRPLNLSPLHKRDLLAFLNSLAGPVSEGP